jgi:hypothetical protein
MRSGRERIVARETLNKPEKSVDGELLEPVRELSDGHAMFL